MANILSEWMNKSDLALYGIYMRLIQYSFHVQHLFFDCLNHELIIFQENTLNVDIRHRILLIWLGYCRFRVCESILQIVEEVSLRYSASEAIIKQEVQGKL